MKLIRQIAENQIVDYIEPVELVDWFSQGESCLLQIGGTSVVVRFIGRKGRRARIAVTAMQRGETGRSSEDVGRGEERVG